MKKIFLTGITGLVGSAFVVALLRERQDCEFVCLARKSAVKSARQRTEEIIRDECKFDGCPELADRILSKVSVIEGDVVDLDPVEMAKNPLLEGVNVVFHCAADVNLGQDPTGRTFRINYQGSKNIVELAKLFGVSTDYLLGLDTTATLKVDGLSEREVSILTELVACFRGKSEKRIASDV